MVNMTNLANLAIALLQTFQSPFKGFGADIAVFGGNEHGKCAAVAFLTIVATWHEGVVGLIFGGHVGGTMETNFNHWS